MINHIWSILCQSSSIDQDNNNLSIFDVLNSLTIYAEEGNEITIPIKYELVSLWERIEDEKPAQGKVKLLFVDPNGTKKTVFERALEWDRTQFYRTRVNMQGLSLIQSGRHAFEVEFKYEGKYRWGRICELPLLIKFKPPKEA